MAQNAPTHPCDQRRPFAPWKKDHLYVGDDGTMLCGSCMGIESTYTPWAWSDLGPMAPDRTVRVGAMKIEISPGRWVEKGPTSYRCETDLYAVRREVH